MAHANYIAMDILRRAVNFCARGCGPQCVQVLVDDGEEARVKAPGYQGGPMLTVRVTRAELANATIRDALQITDRLWPSLQDTLWPNRRRWVREAVLASLRIPPVVVS